MGMLEARPAPPGDPAALFRRLADASPEVWRDAARALGRAIAVEPSLLPRLEELLAVPHARERAVAALASLACACPEAEIHPPEANGAPRAAGPYLQDLLHGRGSPTDAAAALHGVSMGGTSAELAPFILERAAYAPPAVRRAAIECLARHPDPAALDRAREILREAGMWRSETFEDCLEIGRAHPALVRFVVESARASGDRETVRRIVAFLQEVYGSAEQTLQRAILEALFRWAVEDPELPVGRGLFDGAGHREGGSPAVVALEAIQGVALARLYGEHLERSCPTEADRALHLAEGDFLSVRERRAPVADGPDESRLEDRSIAFLSRLVHAEERAFHRLQHLFRSFDEYRELETWHQAEIHLALEACFSGRLAIDPPAEPSSGTSQRGDPFGRFASLRSRLEALDFERRSAWLVELTVRAQRETLSRLEETALSTLRNLVDASPPARLRGLSSVLTVLAARPEPGPVLVDRLAAIVEVHADQILASTGDPEELVRVAYRLLRADPPEDLLSQVARRARDERIGRLFRTFGRLRREAGQAGSAPADLAVSLASFREDLVDLCGRPPSGPLSTAAASMAARLRHALRTPLLAGLGSIDVPGWIEDLERLRREDLLDPSLDPRHLGHLLRDAAAEVETFQGIDFGNVRERLASLGRIEERVGAIERASRALPAIEGRLLAAACGKWDGEIDRAERFFLQLKSSVLAGDPADVLGFAAEGEGGVSRLSRALYRFRVRFLIRRYDIDRAYALILHGPEADSRRIVADQRHARALAAVTLLLYVPYLFYGLGARAVGAFHAIVASLALAFGAAFLLNAGRRDPASSIRLVLPRLLGAIVTWYFVIGLGQEIWAFTIWMDGWRFAFLVALTAASSLLYTYAEVSRHGDPPARTRQKAFTVFAIGLTQSFAIGTFFTSIMGPHMLADRIDALADSRVFGIPGYVEILGAPFFPTIVLSWSFLSLFLGMFLNLMFEDKGMADV